MKQTFRKLFLASSIALAFAGVGSAFAADVKPHDTAREEVADARREAQIWTSFAMNPHLHAFELSVKVDGNKAVLNGKVETEVAKDLAGQIAQDVDGIAHVDNRIVVDAGYVPPARATSERSFGEKVGDATITASVKSKLLWNSHTDGLDIHVDTNNGKVTLTGSAATGAEKDLAGLIAADTNGVMGVNNEIELSNKPDATAKVKSAGDKTEQAVSDTWVTSKVKSSLMFTRGVSSFDIDVSTLNGVVSLKGVVDSAAERELAVRVAQDIRGVKKVDAGELKAH
jgi:osmotically-inducible protein OsmY